MLKWRRARISFPLISIAMAICLVVAGGVDNIARAQSSLPSPTGISVVNGSALGEVDLTWDAVEGATYYRVGWVAEEDYRRALSEPNGEWRKEIRFSNVVNRGQSTWTVTRLTPGIKYAFRVASHNAFYGEPEWSAWKALTLMSLFRVFRPAYSRTLGHRERR